MNNSKPVKVKHHVACLPSLISRFQLLGEGDIDPLVLLLVEPELGGIVTIEGRHSSRGCAQTTPPQREVISISREKILDPPLAT